MSGQYFFTIDDTSTALTYLPWGEGAGGGGWKQYFTGSGYFQAGEDPGAAGQGQTYHVTGDGNSSVSFNFYGTGFTLFGTANCSYQVTVDSQTSDPQQQTSGDVLYTQPQLNQGMHYVTLTSQIAASSLELLMFDYVTVSNTLPDGATTMIPDVIDNSNTTALEYYGNWSVNTDHQIPNLQHPLPYHETKNEGSGVALTFSGASAVAVNGTRNYGNWVYSVTLDGQSVASPNGSTWWIIPDALLYYQDGIDPNQTHTLNITNTSAGENFWLNSITIYKPNSNTDVGVGSSISSSATSSSTSPASSAAAVHHTTNAGAIAGGVIGGLAVLAVTIFALWWWLRSPRHANENKSLDLAESEHDAVMSADPFYSDGASTLPVTVVSARGMVTTPGNQEKRSLGVEPLTSASVRSLPMTPYTARSPSFSVTSFRGSETAQARPLPPPPAAPANLQPADVDMLVEMIARRIDPSGDANRDPALPPPQYRG
ncbi:hypothetical protein GLOTRDRAFT_123864 [Gloeophyllum trabeum ATCC 11539]|uniref:Uncharacterized protein n=1 Tax=Gloeophyllum trabeum (strain ATCC 11539 / FP-39264 / Madison 617) TaxID=670483 RepID=S7QLB5_GLOTA|nr:uncharacterized protein GLOTRDRAFT_123864 [Gloeophyllum trabeum ATCC 11539]EPQ60107.1 hypothetical protein GLOTRDRAFT_123864 [Gloeophyllum trabeum ATCC 11539]